MGMSTSRIRGLPIAHINRLPRAAREDFFFWYDRLCPLIEHPSQIKQALETMATTLGVPYNTVRNKYYRFKNQGPRALLDRRMCPELWRTHNPTQLPELFIDYWKGLVERNQRKSRPAYRLLLRHLDTWRRGRGDPIPGYAQPPGNQPDCDFPRGWSYGNLMRHGPSPFELSVTRRGRSCGAAYRPFVFSTRVGLHCGQYYLFDDLWHDLKVNVEGHGQRSARRPLELCCLDLFSGCKIAWAMKPIIEKTDASAMQRLKESDMRFLLAHLLCNIGYHPQGTTLIVEHGTAAIRPELEAELLKLSDNKIKVSRSGKTGAAAFAGHYNGAIKGNSRFKAALESHHNLIHNELAHLHGQVGKDRTHCPEDIAGRDKHNDAILAAIEALPPETAQRLIKPYYSYIEFTQLASEIYRRIDERRDHKLEGWEEAGLMLHRWRLNETMPWLPIDHLLTLPTEQQQTARALIESNPNLKGLVRMSPREVWDTSKANLIRLPEEALVSIIGPDLGIQRSPQHNGLFEFEDSDLGPGIHRYRARVQGAHGFEETLSPRVSYLTFVNPFFKNQLLVCDSKMRFIGMCPSYQKVRRDDIQALERAMGHVAKVERELLEPVRRRGMELTRQRIRNAQHNINALSRMHRAQPTKSYHRKPAAQTTADELAELTAGLLTHAEETTDPVEHDDAYETGLEALL